MALQDRNTRKLYTANTREKTGSDLVDKVDELLEQVKQDTGENVREINADSEGGFRSAGFQKMLGERNTILRFKQRTREGLSGTAQLDSAIGTWKNTLKKLRGGSSKWWKYADLATDRKNKLSHSGLDGNTPDQAMGGDTSGVMEFRRQEKAADTLEET